MTAPTAADIAARFASLLCAEIGAADFREVVRRNRTPRYRNSCSCASHDFCDANMVMLDAFASFGIDADAVCDCFGPEGERTAHADTWAQAWDLFVKGCTSHGYPDLCADEDEDENLDPEFVRWSNE